MKQSRKAIIKAAAKMVFDAHPNAVPITLILKQFGDALYELCEMDKVAAKQPLQGTFK